MGLCQDQTPLPAWGGGHRVPHSGKTQTVIACDVQRHLYGKVEGQRKDLHNTAVGMQNYGIPLRLSDDSVEDRVSSLKYELKCLYEFGEEEYKFNSDGGKPEKISNIVVNAAQSMNDPRLKQDYTAQAPVYDTGITYS